MLIGTDAVEMLDNINAALANFNPRLEKANNRVTIALALGEKSAGIFPQGSSTSVGRSRFLVSN